MSDKKEEQVKLLTFKWLLRDVSHSEVRYVYKSEQSNQSNWKNRDS